MMYTIHNKCDELPELEYEDGLKFIYFNTTGTQGGTDSIKNLLNYLQDSKMKNVTDDITKAIHDCVCKVKTLPEVRCGYMTLEEKIFYERLDAKEEGREEGKAEAIRVFIETFRELSLSDEIILQKLIEKYSMTKEEAEAQLSN